MTTDNENEFRKEKRKGFSDHFDEENRKHESEVYKYLDDIDVDEFRDFKLKSLNK